MAKQEKITVKGAEIFFSKKSRKIIFRSQTLLKPAMLKILRRLSVCGCVLTAR
jgi:hypothetical protein